jgi:hypothetical protein
VIRKYEDIPVNFACYSFEYINHDAVDVYFDVVAFFSLLLTEKTVVTKLPPLWWYQPHNKVRLRTYFLQVDF